jgi:hypothetical protein
VASRFSPHRRERELTSQASFKRYPHRVSHTTPTESAVADSPSPRWWKSPRWHTLAPLVIAIIALAIAIAAWLQPSRESASSTFTDQSGDAKTNLCSAYKVVRQGVVINTHLANPGGNDPGRQLAVAANARLALLGGGAYLRDRLAAQASPPADLAKAVNSMANTIEQLGVNYLANADNSLQVPLRHDLDSQLSQLDKLCA